MNSSKISGNRSVLLSSQPVYADRYNQLIDNITPNYKVYTALLTQAGTDAPVATILENTIGDIVWSYDVAGSYYGTLMNTFYANKTYLYCGGGQVVNPFADQLERISRASDDLIWIQTGNYNANTVDDILYNTSIEIRVYN